MAKKVLLVEDHPAWLKIIEVGLKSRVTVLSAPTIREAEQMIKEHPDIDLVIMDACVPGDIPNTEPLVRKIRKTFEGPILAISGSERYRQQLLDAGCDCGCDKPQASEKALEMLGIS